MIKEKLNQIAPVNMAVVAANVIVFFIMEILGDTKDTLFMLEHGASFAPLIFEKHQYWRLLTCMFLHFGSRHLFNNMLVLAFVGDRLEKFVGKLRYVLIYFGGGLLAGVISAGLDYFGNDFYVSAGASGAVFAVVGALAWLIIRHRGQLYDISIQQIILFIIFSIYLGFQGGSVDNAAHVGGLVCGFVLSMLFCGRKLKYR